MSKTSIPDKDGNFSGDGFIRDKGEDRGVRVCLPTHMATADPTMAQDLLLSSKALGTYPNRRHPQKARQTKLAVLGIPSSILELGSPAYHRTVKLAQAYKKARARELFQAHGYVSSGVGALLAAASLALSASRFLYEIAASLPIQAAERGDLSMPTVLKLASGLSDSARQNELSAWELCARESVIKKRNDANNVQVPWMIQGTVDNPLGEVKRGPGRPRKVSLLTEGMNNAGADSMGEIEGSGTEGAGIASG